VLQKSEGGRGADASPSHAGIDFDMDAALVSDLLAFLCDEIGFEFRADRELEIKSDEVEDLVFMDCAEDENGKAYVGLPELDPYLQMGDGEVSDASLFGSFTNGTEAVAIGIGLHGKAEHPMADIISDEGDVFFKLREIDFDPGGMGKVFAHYSS
jgi:hypothetical protein